MEAPIRSKDFRGPAEEAPSSGSLYHLLSEVASYTESLGSRFSPQAKNLHALLDRLLQRRFHLAVLGQFKRGKSSLLNALLGEEILPASVVPLTAIPTFIRGGEKRRAEVIFIEETQSAEYEAVDAASLNKFIAQYVTEEANPENRLGVSYVEVYHPSSILREGVVLIDTPGIGSTHRHNTEATLNFIPQCDAALFVVSPDPPITEVEIDFLGEVRSRINRIFYVLTKADYLNEPDREQLIKFLRSVLHEQAGMEVDTRILSVSARLGLEARQKGDEQGWAKSGMKEVERLLLDFLVHEKDNALSEAIACKASDALNTVLLELRLSEQSLKMPLEELQRRLEVLKSRLIEADSQRILEKDTLEGDKKRTVAFLEEQAEQLRKKARKRFLQTAQEALEEHHADTDAAQNALAEVIPAFFEHELGEMSRALEERVSNVLKEHRRRIENLVEEIRKTAAELFDVPYDAAGSEEEFVVETQPHWVTHHWPMSLGLLPETFWDRFLPYGMRKSRAFQRIRNRVDSLVAQNVENVRWPTLQNLNKSFREFANALDNRIEEALSATRGAIEAIYEKRRIESKTIEEEEVRLQADIANLERMQNALRAYCRGENSKGG